MKRIPIALVVLGIAALLAWLLRRPLPPVTTINRTVGPYANA